MSLKSRIKQLEAVAKVSAYVTLSDLVVYVDAVLKAEWLGIEPPPDPNAGRPLCPRLRAAFEANGIAV